ncbi:MAG: 6-phosphogluconolactonase [Bacteroidales bacterium]
MITRFNIYENAEQTCVALATRLALLAQTGGCVALSGGNTPKLLFKIMAEQFPAANWNNLWYFWGDERMVPSESQESNYGVFYREFAVPAVIDGSRILATDFFPDTRTALTNILEKLKNTVPFVNGLPRFDLIILGIGEDGHVASIFPENLASFSLNEHNGGSPDELTKDSLGTRDGIESGAIAEIIRHPVNGQQRITLTGRTLNNACEVAFLCTGEGKSGIIYDIIKNRNMNLPATHVAPQRVLNWYMDGFAAQKIESYEK